MDQTSDWTEIDIVKGSQRVKGNQKMIPDHMRRKLDQIRKTISQKVIVLLTV